VRGLDQLCEFVSIPSVSTDPKHGPDMRSCCQWLVNWAQARGLRAEIWETAGHPAVFIQSPPVKGAPTLLIYGHYDVQPAEEPALWATPPFQPEVREDRLYGRGASDNKGQIFMHLLALEQWLEQGAPMQIKVLIEGEEEVGSPNLPALLEQKRAQLQSDLVMVSDTSTALKGVPTLHYSLRGIVIFEVHLQVAARDVHSGVFGGTSPNATHELAKIISGLHNERRQVVIPGFYDRVRPLEGLEKEALEKVPFDQSAYQGFIGCRELVGEEGFSSNARRWFRPTLDCNGMGGGFQGEGSKTIVPAKAWAKFSARLVPDQRPDEVMECCRKYFEAIEGVTFLAGDGGPPYLLDPTGPASGYLQMARQALQKHFEQEPLLVRHGGAIPIVSQFETILGLSTLLMGFGSPDDAIHSPNEKFELNNFRRGMPAILDFYRAMAGCK
jgi:acetylornithine deacetylase/succinyl-diaminopimelate desuccinylase-like protein